MSDEMEEQVSDAEVLEPALVEEIPAAVSHGDGWFHAITTSTPWWLISVVFHVLLIILASVVSSAINLGQLRTFGHRLGVVAPGRPEMKERPRRRSQERAGRRSDTKATDPTSKEISSIDVPPDILAKAELGDHFETINLDRPDTHSAFGNPDAHMFHSVKGSDDKAGGGGTGGTSSKT